MNTALFNALWDSYAAITPSAPIIHDLLTQRGESIRNDHVALRTLDLDPIGLEALSAPFLESGWRESGRYDFAVKKLNAVSLSKDNAPRVFISELRTQDMSPWSRDRLGALVAQIKGPIEAHHLSAGTLWDPVSWQDYERLLSETQYGAWVAAFGLRANHFTVAVNDLTTFGERPLEALNDWLKTQGYTLNSSGGEIKGNPSVMLEQSSTLADRVPVTFADDATHTIPSCYSEFALRHPDPSTGALFDGFVTGSADKIFESTNTDR